MNKKILFLLLVAILISLVVASRYTEDYDEEEEEFAEDFDEEDTDTLTVTRDCRINNRNGAKGYGMKYAECRESDFNGDACQWCWDTRTMKSTQDSTNGYCEYGRDSTGRRVACPSFHNSA